MRKACIQIKGRNYCEGWRALQYACAMLRNLIITGLALHTIAPELPRLLASMPVPPASVSELQALILQMAGSGLTEADTAAVLATEQQVLSFTLSSGTQTAGIKKNMRRAFGE